MEVSRSCDISSDALLSLEDCALLRGSSKGSIPLLMTFLGYGYAPEGLGDLRKAFLLSHACKAWIHGGVLVMLPVSCFLEIGLGVPMTPAGKAP